METFSALLAFYAGNSPVTGEFLSQRPRTRSYDVFFDLRLYKRLSKQSWGWWLRLHCAHYDVTVMIVPILVMDLTVLKLPVCLQMPIIIDNVDC